MIDAISRSWMATKVSFGVMKKDKELLLFPILGGIFSLLFTFALLFPNIISGLLAQGGNMKFTAMEYIFLFITYFGLAFVATFFNVCVVYTAKTRFEGGNATFFESIGFAFKKIHLIFVWSIVSATVGLLLRILDKIAENTKGTGRILLKLLRALLGVMWSLLTVFVVPAMVYQGIGPFAAIKKSVQTFRKTWGENLIRRIGLGLMQSFFIVLGIIVGGILIFLVSGLGVGAMVIVGVCLLVYLIIVFAVFSVANTIFSTALYVYAEQGTIPEGFSQHTLHDSIRSR